MRSKPPPPTLLRTRYPATEWTRFLVVLESQGQSQESIHPNYYGQRALGTCLTKLRDHTGTEKNHVCTGTPGRAPEEVSLTSSNW